VVAWAIIKMTSDEQKRNRGAIDSAPTEKHISKNDKENEKGEAGHRGSRKEPMRMIKAKKC